MDEKEIKYTILTDDGDSFSYEKAVIEHKDSSRSKVATNKARIAEIKAHIDEENELISSLEAEIAELEEVIAIADEKKNNEVIVEENEQVE